MNEKIKHKIVIISDTHTMHSGLENKFELPAADFIVHCGDVSGHGDEYSTKQFLNWFSNLYQYEHKIFIAGNHDWLFESTPSLTKKIVSEYSNKNVYYLEDSGIELWGVKFWGTPVSKEFNNWAFNRPEEKMKQHWNAIPSDTNVLITHNPPHMIGDFVPRSNEHVGSLSLYKEVVERIKPSIHCFGHIHEGYGIDEINNIKFINASVLDGGYKLINPPIIVEIEI